MQDRRLSRRDFLRMSALTAAGAVLAGCACPTPEPEVIERTVEVEKTVIVAPEEKAKLVFWSFFDREFMRVPYEEGRFHEDTGLDHVEVEFITIPYGSLHDQTLIALETGVGAPDLVDIEAGQYSRFLKGETVGFLPLEDELGPEIEEKLYMVAATDRWTYRGHIHGIGNEVNACALFYRWDVVQDYVDISDGTPFKTWGDLVDFGLTYKQDTGKETFSLMYDGSGDWIQMVNQLGGGYVDEAGEITFDDETSVYVLTWLQDAGYEHEVAVIGQQAWEVQMPLFEDDELIVAWGPPWYATYGLKEMVTTKDGLWQLQLLPAWNVGGARSASLGGTGTCITNQCQHVPEAIEWLRWVYLTDVQMIDFVNRGILPSLKDLWDDPRMHGPDPYFNGQDYTTVLTPGVDEIPQWHNSPWTPEIGDAFQRLAVTPILLEQADIKTALAAARVEAEAMIEDAGGQPAL